MSRPVILLGQGARHNPDIIWQAQHLHIPILTTWMACDMIPEDHPCYCGRPGIFGMRASNIIQQKATMLYCIGARLDGEQVAYDYGRFAPNAHKVICDVDQAELDKLPDWEKYCIDLNRDNITIHEKDAADWLSWCKALYNRFRPELEGVPLCKGRYADSFYIMRKLSEAAQPDDVLAISSSGGAPCSFLQTFKVKQGQRIVNLSSFGPMGADVPMAMGAAVASGRRVICPTGDGGFVMNASCIETIHALRMNIAFIVLNNNGYNSIRTMQDARFEGRRYGADPASGLHLPNIQKIANAYGAEYYRPHPDDLEYILNLTPNVKVIEFEIDPEWRELPRVMASTVDGQLRTDDMQDMTPKLPEDELRKIMEA